MSFFRCIYFRVTWVKSLLVSMCTTYISYGSVQPIASWYESRMLHHLPHLVVRHVRVAEQFSTPFWRWQQVVRWVHCRNFLNYVACVRMCTDFIKPICRRYYNSNNSSWTICLTVCDTQPVDSNITEDAENAVLENKRHVTLHYYASAHRQMCRRYYVLLLLLFLLFFQCVILEIPWPIATKLCHILWSV